MEYSEGLPGFILVFVGQALLKLGEFLQCNGLVLIQYLEK
jgi:hypothetical protein